MGHIYSGWWLIKLTQIFWEIIAPILFATALYRCVCLAGSIASIFILFSVVSAVQCKFIEWIILVEWFINIFQQIFIYFKLMVLCRFLVSTCTDWIKFLYLKYSILIYIFSGTALLPLQTNIPETLFLLLHRL